MPVTSALNGAHKDGIILASNALKPEILHLVSRGQSFPLTSSNGQADRWTNNQSGITEMS